MTGIEIPTIAIIHSKKSDQDILFSALAQHTAKTILSPDINKKLIEKEHPNVILIFPHHNTSHFLEQIRQLRQQILLNQSCILVVEKEMHSAKTESYIKAGCDFVISYNQLDQLPSFIEIFFQISRYRSAQSITYWESLFHHFRQPIFLCDEDFKIYLANARACSLTQNNQQSMFGLSLLDFLPSKQIHEIRARSHRCIAKNSSLHNIQVTLKTFSEDFLPCSLAMHCVGKIQKTKHALLYVFQENSEIESIKLKSFLLQSVLDKSASSILITNAQGTIFYANPSFLKRVQLDSSDVLSRSSEDLSIEYQLHRREDALPYTKLGFTYFKENDYIDSSGTYIHEREKILPIVFNPDKRDGFLIRIAEYAQQTKDQNETHNHWFYAIMEKTSAQIDTFWNAQIVSSQDLTRFRDNSELLVSILRRCKIMEGFCVLQQHSTYTYKNCSLNDLLNKITIAFSDYGNIIHHLQKTIPDAYIDKNKVEFAFIALLEAILEKWIPKQISFNTSPSRNSILFVLRISPMEETVSDSKAFVMSLLDKEIWVVKQILNTHPIGYEVSNELNGSFAIFFNIPSVNDSMAYKEQEISELL